MLPLSNIVRLFHGGMICSWGRKEESERLSPPSLLPPIDGTSSHQLMHNANDMAQMWEGLEIKPHWSPTSYEAVVETEEGWLFGTRYLEVHDDKSYKALKASSDASSHGGYANSGVRRQVLAPSNAARRTQHGGGYCEATSTRWWLTTLLRIWKATIKHLPWVKYYRILSHLTLWTVKDGYYFLPFYSWENSLKEFQKLAQRLPPPKVSVKLSFRSRSPWCWTPSSWHLHGSETPEKIVRNSRNPSQALKIWITWSGVGPRPWYLLLMGSQDKEPLPEIMEMSFLSL